MAATRNRRDRNRTGQRKSQSHLRFETTGKSETTQIFSRCNPWQNSYRDYQKNRQITKIIEEKYKMAMGNGTRK